MEVMIFTMRIYFRKYRYVICIVKICEDLINKLEHMNDDKLGVYHFLYAHVCQQLK